MIDSDLYSVLHDGEYVPIGARVVQIFGGRSEMTLKEFMIELFPGSKPDYENLFTILLGLCKTEPGLDRLRFMMKEAGDEMDEVLVSLGPPR